jgi:hypothetical protein
VIVVFQTAKIVRVVSPVVAVVISVEAAPPRVRLQPPKAYPALDVVVLLARDSVESLNEPSETRVAVSDAGVELPKVLISKTIVGLAAVVALAEEGIEVRQAMASRPVRTREVVLFVSDVMFEPRNVDMAFPSMVRLVLLRLTLGLQQEGHWYQQAVNNLRILRWLRPSFVAVPTE